MLLLILLAAGLTSGAAQTTSFPTFFTGTSTTETPFTHSVQSTVQSTVHSAFTNNTVAILQTTIQSSQQLNETTIAPVLHKLYNIIQQLQPHLNFTLTVKNMTEV